MVSEFVLMVFHRYKEVPPATPPSYLLMACDFCNLRAPHWAGYSVPSRPQSARLFQMMMTTGTFYFALTGYFFTLTTAVERAENVGQFVAG